MTYIIPTAQVIETVAPVVEPVSLVEARAHLREPDVAENTLISSLITGVRQWVEHEYHISTVQKTYRADLWWFRGRFRLPYPPLTSISSIKYYTDDSPQVLTTLDSEFYRTDLGRSEIYIDADSGSIPSVAPRHDAVQITFITGYAAGTDSPIDFAANVPEDIKSAIKLVIGDLFENREGKIVGTIQSTNPAVKMLLARYREY